MKDYARWEIEGTPCFIFESLAHNVLEKSGSVPVNRIKSVLSSRPGYVPTSELGPIL